ncbi:MAG TPA: hypothetical protein VFQ28_11305 [Gaiella sp.]|nr:hypothetical protein [Gaiella sp.]
MPWSWVRVSTRTSPKLRSCKGTDNSSATIKQCITTIVTQAGGALQHGNESGEVKFEGNGKFARLKFFWADLAIKRDVIYDLEADEVVDLLDDDERDGLLPRDPTS